MTPRWAALLLGSLLANCAMHPACQLCYACELGFFVDFCNSNSTASVCSLKRPQRFRDPGDVKKHTMKSLEVAPVGDGHHGRDFYKFFFTEHPEVRQFYKGAEEFKAEDVQKSERFDKLGDAILLFVHVLANTYDNEPVFRAFTRRTMKEHFDRGIDPKYWKSYGRVPNCNLSAAFIKEPVFRAFTRRTMKEHFDRGIDPKYWKLFWGIWMDFLMSKGAKLTDEQKEAWDTLGKMFNEESQAYLAKLGLPHI
ncbi:unnamed protein product [Strongylus vulgaris]|uniref:Globin domain-containing protein n=1 Tax=Strongylus vulgaris TaxID=40348 RepID=A0A3P7L7J6_STRVU|nr:unnamed protein product [Strongylus vulgaris]